MPRPPAPPALPALQLARTPRIVRRLAWAFVVVLFGIVPALAVTPWQQTVHGSGRTLAYNPVQRTQPVVSPIEGRVFKWHVVEGQHVQAGDPLVRLVDNDPLILERLRDQRQNVENRLRAAQERREALDRQILQLDLLLISQLTAQDGTIAAFEAEVRRAEQEKVQADATDLANRLALDRTAKLFNSQTGAIASRQELERAQRESDFAVAGVKRAGDGVVAAEERLIVAKQTRSQLEANTKAIIERERAGIQSAVGDIAAVRQQRIQLDTQIARQENLEIFAAADGTVHRILANAEAGGQLVRPGERLAMLVPDVQQDKPVEPQQEQGLAAVGGGVAGTAVEVLTDPGHPGIVAELLIDGNDLPLVRAGDRVLLQFEGWPAVQFAAYPEAATGTFEGRIYVIDPTSDPAAPGRFRVLVRPGETKPDGSPAREWPNQELLRQGVRAQGWTLLNRVTLGWEVWRQLNGFPPFREIKGKSANAALGPVTKVGGK